MCGIVGFITKPNLAGTPSKWEAEDAHKRAMWLKNALIFDTVRGEHSTGVMGRYAGESDWLKQAVTGYEFVQTKEFKEDWLAVMGDYDVVVGHNRAATMGEINNDNAHPFEHGDVTLVHNGTLSDLGPLEHQQKDIEVDSSLIAYNLSMAEPGDAAKVIGQLDGAYALVWLDKRDNSVNIVRNGHRPLHMAQSTDKRTLFFMSEGKMLDFVCDRTRNRHSGIFTLGTHQLLKFTDGSLVPEVQTVAPFTRPRRAYPTYDTGSYRAKGGSGYTTASAHLPPNKDLNIQLGPSNKVPQPKVFKEILSWFDLDIADELEFDPDVFYEYPVDRAIKNEKRVPIGDVQGEVFVPCMGEFVQCRLVGVGGRLFEQYYKENWTVRPMCITWEDDTMTIHAKFVKIGLTEDAKTNTLKYSDDLDEEVQFDKEETDYTELWKDKDDEQSFFKGPRGYVTLDKALDLLEDGCAMCSDNLKPADMGEYLWVGEHQDQPLCPDCQTEAAGFCS